MAYFSSLNRTIEKFVSHVATQISTGKVQRKTMSQAASKEYHEQARLLNDKDFLKSNCRIPASTKQKEAGTEEDPYVVLANDRERCKTDAVNRVNEATRKKELANKKGGGKLPA